MEDSFTIYLYSKKCWHLRSLRCLEWLRQFLPVFAVARCPSVRLSVCLSVTFMHSIQTAEDIVKLLGLCYLCYFFLSV